MDLFRFVPGYTTNIYETGREPALVMLLSFIVTFVCARGYTRVARVRGWRSGAVGGVHLHHIVVGILLAFSAGAVNFAFTPAQGPVQLLLAAAFGAGAALVFDEFALVFYLEDVYWAQEGRASVDAILLSTALGGVLLLRSMPLGGTNGESTRWGVTIWILINGAFVAVTALKGKVLTAIIAVFVPPVGIVGAIRLGRPSSIWGRWRYHGDKRARAERRQARHTARWQPIKERARDLIGGSLPAEHRPPL